MLYTNTVLCKLYFNKNKIKYQVKLKKISEN